MAGQTPLVNILFGVATLLFLIITVKSVLTRKWRFTFIYGLMLVLMVSQWLYTAPVQYYLMTPGLYILMALMWGWDDFRNPRPPAGVKLDK